MGIQFALECFSQTRYPYGCVCVRVWAHVCWCVRLCVCARMCICVCVCVSESLRRLQISLLKNIYALFTFLFC